MCLLLYTRLAKKSIDKIDNVQRKLIKKWIEKNLIGCTNPYFSGKALKGNLKGLWRYRVGSYRIIAQIDNNIVKIFLLSIGHRKEIYD